MLCEVRSALIKSAGFSPILMVGAFLFPVVLVGMMDERMAGLRREFVHQRREAHCYCQIKQAGATIPPRADRHCLG
ncbi:hypothetical protein IFO70_28325 [Phormidium tenue FACHB-886]|nr:hypothetical protein [Phormidium tenue FACHB-886]